MTDQILRTTTFISHTVVISAPTAVAGEPSLLLEGDESGYLLLEGDESGHLLLEGDMV